MLAARSTEGGVAAVKQLESEGLAPEFIKLDVSDKDSIQAARKIVEEKYGRLDVLINNAGINLRVKDTVLSDRARQTININYFGVLNVTNAFWSLLQPNSRVVHVSSQLGRLSYLGESWQEKINSPDLTVEQLSAYMKQYIIDASSPDIDRTCRGWHTYTPPYSDSYSVSKVGVTRLAAVQAKLLETDPRPGILINAVCPGWVRSDMGGAGATYSLEEGADTPVYLSLLPAGTKEPNGKYVSQRKVRTGYA